MEKYNRDFVIVHYELSKEKAIEIKGENRKFGELNESHKDIEETVKFLNSLNYKGLKIHSTFIEKDTGCKVLATDVKGSKDLSLVIKLLTDLAEPKIQALMAKGLLRRPARAMVVGMPNVGKSSLFNSLGKKQQALVSSRQGTTRDVNRLEIKYKGK